MSIAKCSTQHKDSHVFQHGEASTDFSVDVRSALDTSYPGRWIERGDPLIWPACPPGLSCLELFLSGHMKSLLYVDFDESLSAWNALVAGVIREMPEIINNARQSLPWRCDACIFAGGCSFKQFL
ncbi:uncharacterized protein TNCV_4486511 [Trichonephila clavipes]|nr:uncharacterized protein TNCV_4486511 [Trichonephila clavipes]